MDSCPKTTFQHGPYLEAQLASRASKYEIHPVAIGSWAHRRQLIFLMLPPGLLGAATQGTLLPALFGFSSTLLLS